jgi:hypothetical protein
MPPGDTGEEKIVKEEKKQNEALQGGKISQAGKKVQ